MNLFDKINEDFEGMSPANKKVALYISKNWEKVCMMTAKELSQIVQVSDATVHRVAQQLGFQSFIAMKKYIRENCLSQRPLLKLMRKSTENHEVIKDEWLANHFGEEIGSLKKTYAMNKSCYIDESAEMIIKASKIWVAGPRLGIIISSSLNFILNYMLGNCNLIDMFQSAEAVSYMKSGDVLIVTAFQRYCPNTFRLVKRAKEKGIKIIVFTDCELSPFKKYGDIVFFADTSSSYFLDSYTSTLVLVNAVISKIAYKADGRIKENIKEIEENYKRFSQSFNWEE